MTGLLAAARETTSWPEAVMYLGMFAFAAFIAWVTFRD